MELALIWNKRRRTTMSFIVTCFVGLFLVLFIVGLSNPIEIIAAVIAWVLIIGAIPNIVVWFYFLVKKRYDEGLFVSLIYVFLIFMTIIFIGAFLLEIDLSGFDFVIKNK